MAHPVTGEGRTRSKRQENLYYTAFGGTIMDRIKTLHRYTLAGDQEMSKPRSGTSYRLSEDAQVLLDRLAGRLGLTKTSVLEMAIRKLAYSEFGETAFPLNVQATPERRKVGKVVAQAHKN